MKTVKIVFVVFITFLVVITTAFFLINYFKPKPGGLMVDTTPNSNVYIDGNFMGKTPYKGTNAAGQISLRLVPSITDQNLIAYETKVNLVSGIQTVVRREFGTAEDLSSGDVISFDKTGGDAAGLVVISTPDNSQVLVDGVPQGFSPYNLSSVTSGSHTITVKSQGFTDRIMSVKTQAGYRLTVFAKLAKSQEALPTPPPSPTPVALNKSYVLIGDTPTGFLRMRSEATTSASPLAELKTGQKYLYLETDQASGWFKIQYEDPAAGLPNGITGWVSNQYSSIVK
jgi:hypothetical protein